MDRDEFTELVYETFADEPDNVLANGIIEAADSYAEYEKAKLSQQGTTKDATSDTIQPKPKEGHWINGKCDLCGEHAPFWAMASTYHERNYCPNCGARMKGATP